MQERLFGALRDLTIAQVRYLGSSMLYVKLELLYVWHFVLHLSLLGEQPLISLAHTLVRRNDKLFRGVLEVYGDVGTDFFTVFGIRDHRIQILLYDLRY